MTEVLTQLAIAEKKPKEVLKWYDHGGCKKGPSGMFGFSLDEEVVEAVKSTHPDRAVAIWKEIAEKNIARVQASGYQAAVPYLRKVRDVLNRSRRKDAWQEYLAALRLQNRRRSRCLEELDRLEGGRRRITDS